MAVKLSKPHLPQLLPWLEQYLPHSFKPYEELKFHLKGKFPDLEFFVDRWPNPQAAVAMVNPASEKLYYKKMVLGLYGTPDEALAALLKDDTVVSWNTGTVFCAVPDNLWHVVQAVAEDKGSTVDFNPNFLLKATPQDLNPIPVPDGMKISPISDDNVSIVNSTWKFASEGSEDIFREQVHKQPSAFLTMENGQHVGHMLGNRYGAMGVLYVCPEFRRRGYAKVIVSQLAQKYFERGDDAYVFIEVDNPPSLSLHQSLGFRIIPDLKVSWMRCLPKNSSECMSRKCCV